MTDSMVERVARAICIAREQDPDARTGFALASSPQISLTYLDGAMAEARSAIAAMREPTEAMVSDGYCEAGGTDVDTAKVWRFMIDAALEQRGEEG